MEEPASDPDGLQSQVLQNTLQEVAKRDEQGPDCCVICLDAISEPCEIRPCGHRNFDYTCIANWLHQKLKCPLCNQKVYSALHGDPVGSLTTAFCPEMIIRPKIPEPVRRPAPRPTYSPHVQWDTLQHEAQSWTRHQNPRRRPSVARQPEPSTPRAEIYRRGLYSKHVGSNRLSRYSELTPHMFTMDGILVSRAKMFIRRELRVFAFLYTDAGRNAAQRAGPSDLRTSNAEFLLEYIVAILKSVDIMGSAGQAAHMLSDFLGEESARLFLHELRAWLRSPFTKLEDWDRAVQYDDDDNSQPAYKEDAPGPETRRGRNRDRYVSDRYRERYSRKGDLYRPSDANNGTGSGGRARARYEPYGNGRRSTETRP